MFEYIKGIYISLNKDYIVVESNNIGYKIYTSGNTMSNMPNINEEVKIYIEQIVREDFMGIYGFLTEEERAMFNLLLTINGVGSKAALSLLSISNVSNLKKSILSEDYKMLTKAPGIGKKIAQRITLELKDKIEKIYEDNLEDIDNLSKNSTRKYDESLEALIALGFSQKEAEKALKDVDMSKGIEEIIKNSLRYLMN
ncbi:Holliday junction branch migration protein RuvA [Clostridium botulinum]|uniref:Holliday junction branch migration complex subunit RuvA n=1 Tax=Clostridium botulinum D str. 1873 TaxID=592027 RepID=A0A9P2G6D8_CLOBO|nr:MULTISPECIES: Holliday junction branch migration protein RuvA [Clostridium]NFV47376.1 Holliday junction branch migration protein RuvA [Clostridium botulinum]EES90771.1 holliday junction DNA helicase RuvA [Clostridium botulinum D str. 1873]MBO3442015.1 Holliday junction branch migration protein RuvA [Clostridium haemolyticum]MCD3244518.1 Holliday junction branch migration protein RuvA [Clostridium botulinum C]MCD3261077.1 Holliday junction branch migration protein RuvA [Clostridium botulinum